MSKPLDVSKFRKNLTKAIPGLSIGVSDPDTWIDTGNYALNFFISSSFFKGVPLGKVTIFAGESGSGKSYIASGNIVRECQRQGITPIIFDTENALDKTWLENLGVDTSEDKLIKIAVTQLDDLSKLASEFISDYNTTYSDVDDKEKPKFMFIIDSLGALLTPTEITQFDEGKTSKGDMGRKAKALNALVKNLNCRLTNNIGIVATNHTYESQDMYNPDQQVSGGKGQEFMSSIMVLMRKLKLKEDETGAALKYVNGIRCKIKVTKSRFAKPFEEVEIQIPYDTGMNPYSGLFELFEKLGLIKKVNASIYSYTNNDGVEVHRGYRKTFTHEIFDVIMRDYKEERVPQPDDADMDEVGDE